MGVSAKFEIVNFASTRNHAHLLASSSISAPPEARPSPTEGAWSSPAGDAGAGNGGIGFIQIDRFISTVAR